MDVVSARGLDEREDRPWGVIDMQMETVVAAAVLGPAMGAVAAYQAWAVYVYCRERYRTRSDRRIDQDCLMAVCEE